MSVTGTPTSGPVKVGVPITDLGAGLFATIGILAALHHRSTSGAGQHIDTSLVDAGLALSVWEVAGLFHDRPGAGAAWLGAPADARRIRRFACADGHITIGAANDRNFHKVARVLGHHEWLADARFSANHQRDRSSRGAGAADRSGDRQAARSRSGSSELEQAGVPCGPILNYEDALTTPQAIAREMTVDVDHPTLGPLRTLGTPIKMSATPLNPKRRGPMLGEHTDDVLMEAGYSSDEIEQLRYSGAVADVDVLQTFDSSSTSVLRSICPVQHDRRTYRSTYGERLRMMNMRISRTVAIIFVSGALAASVAAQRGGGTRVAAGRNARRAPPKRVRAVARRPQWRRRASSTTGRRTRW